MSNSDPSLRWATDGHARFGQMFPTLAPDEVERLRKFGQPRRFEDGEALFLTGQPGRGMVLVISGHVCISQRDGLGHVVPIVEQGPGQFVAEVGSLSGQPSQVDGHAEGEVEVIQIAAADLRRLLIAEAELGERIMRALILRRVGLIETNAGGPVLIGPASSPGIARLRSFLSRNGQPHHMLDPETDGEAAAIVARDLAKPEDLPLVIAPDGTLLRNPSEVELARALGMGRLSDRDKVYDAAIVGAGPGGLSTAVYAASEGLSVLVLDGRAFGGQAGASARIENYLGFPTGITGQALTGRAFVQAQKFGAEMMIPVEVKRLDCARADGALAVELGGGDRIRAKALVIASGARYRRPPVQNLAAFEGRGVWYWASPIEARLCADEEVVLVGGGNSAGQGAVFLAANARKVWMMVRSDGLAASMSSYLIDRIAATPNIELLTHTELVAVEGSATGVERVRWRDNRTGETTEKALRNVFLFAGAEPATGWLDGCGVEVDKAGFVVTGAALETSVPGVFAVGDVRSGSVKRVGAAIGEGAQVVAALHRFLAGREGSTA